MRIYLAGGIMANNKPLWKEELGRIPNGVMPTQQKWESFEIVGKLNINILESFYYLDDTVTKAIPFLKHFMLDSGAFTFFTKKTDGICWEDYLERYAAYINENDIKHFFELDIDRVIGYPKVLALREKLKRLTGKEPIPVWHKNRGKDEFIKMCQQYKYVALGGLAAKEIKRNEYKFIPWFIDTAHKYKAKIHGLGFTNLEGLKRYHFDSVDSTAWVSGNRFGAVYKFNGQTMVKFNAPENHRLASSRVAALNNFKEWVKFCEYAEKNL
jgi:hypothetical protein